MGDSAIRLGLRAIAIAIAIAAAIDPSITTRRATKPDVVVLAGDSVSDGALASDVARGVGKTYTVARRPIAGASATIVAGRRLTAGEWVGDAPVFAVSPAADQPTVTIEALDAPVTAPVISRVRVEAQLRVTGARGKTIDVTLRDGALAVDHRTRRIASDDDTLGVLLSFVPPAPSVTTLRVVAHVDGAFDATGDALVEVQDRKWAVLFYDPRPSWMSTFVRRAIERDPRFVATSRVVTSRDVATDAGNPPGRLDDLSALSLFDAVIVGAPQAMSANDAAGLEAFMRKRGGSVVLLLDEQVPGPQDRLIGVDRWMSASGNALLQLRAANADSTGLQATSIVWPATLPVGATVIAGGARAAVWREPVGAGTLVVSGALDAWRFRDPASSPFERFWRTTIGDAASLTPSPITLAASRRIVAPGERVDLDATLRDEAIGAPAGVIGPLQLRATIGTSPDSGDAIHMWPRASGRLAGRVRAPNTPGVYRVSLSAGGRDARLAVVVARRGSRITRGSGADLDDLVRATGGATISASQLARLPALLARDIHVEPRLVTWHPMRSGWWIFPFVLGLSGEWWLRRRRGLP